MKELVLAWAGRTTYCRWGDLNNRHVLLTVVEAGKSEIKVLAGLASGESTLPGLQKAAFSLCPHVERDAKEMG